MTRLNWLTAGASLAALAVASAAHATPVVPKGATVTAAAATAPVSFQVYLPLRDKAALEQLVAAQQTPGSASYHKYLTPAQFATRFGPTADAISAAKTALASQGLTVTAAHIRSLDVTGTAGAVQKAFGSPLSRVVTTSGHARFYANQALAPAASIKALGLTTFAFSALPEKKTNAAKVANADPENRFSASGGYYFTDRKQAYDYPSYTATAGKVALDGSGINVAIVMENDALDSDVKLLFDHENFTTVTGKPAPTFIHKPINGGAPFDVNASFESSLDVQEVLGGAPGSTVTLFNLPDLSDANIQAGYQAIIDDGRYDAVNSSFGGCELFSTDARYFGGDGSDLLFYHEQFLQGNAEGVTFVASSGDEGGLSCPDVHYVLQDGTPTRFIPSIQFPSNDPNVTGVGGGNLITTADGTLNSAYVSEQGLGDPEIPHDTYGFGQNIAGGFWGPGGGPSAFWAKPDYQSLVTTGSSQRTTPDVGMLVGGCPGGESYTPCGPNRSYVIVADGGSRYGVIGTSVSSPEFVGAMTLSLQYQKQTTTCGSDAPYCYRYGNANPFFYRAAATQNAGGAKVFHRETSGFDGKWTDKVPGGGYDYLFGNGSPDVRALFGLLTVTDAAGLPQTATNP